MAPRKLPPGISVRVNQDGSKTYRLRWRQGGRSGPQLSHSYDRLNEAVDAQAKIKANGSVCTCSEHAPEQQIYGDQGPGITSRPGNTDGLTFGQALREHAEHLTGVGEGHRARYVRDLERHFATFLSRPLVEITHQDVRGWLRGCERGAHPWLLRRIPGTTEYEPRPLGVRTTKRLMVQAGAIYRQRGLPNPFAGHRLQRDDHERTMRALTPEQWRLVEAELPAGWARDLCRVLLGTGARWGEVTALRVGDVDPFRATVRIERAWKSDGHNGFLLGPPKSRKSRRTVDLDADTLDALLPHLAGKKAEELVFTTERSTPVRSANFGHRIWRPAITRAQAKGLPFAPRIHDLRHTCATWLISGGISPILVSRQLGHESYQTTANIYSDVLPEDRGRATAVMAAALTR